MKSSRLLSILLLLQTRGRMTAAELAAELEVSPRTVYRDVESLHAAGVPLYGDAGHRGGYRLLAGYRTRLTGMNAGEAEALFLAGAPGPAAELGLGPALAAAQLKLRAALPPELREQADRMRTRFHLDAPGWYAADAEAPFLPQVADAVWHGRVLQVRYRRWKEPTDVDRRLEPYGLVLKAGRWYTVAGPGPRTYRVDQILRLSVAEERFEVPADFDLADHWRRYQEDFHARLHAGDAEVRLSPRGAARLTGAAARAMEATGVAEPGGWRRATLPTESLDQAHAFFLSLGADAEVLAPPELRSLLAATARTLADAYGSPPAESTR
ncbi:helix-turn-helix transcriptional regulator [Actinacidiphila paucisporea]|uniref:Predicted DNA-binding transcriptional regulator YafY, contains an HTH and WYL domains n=1 Tax=Actinacidiphila paucisporea TaxID=310782 RepID=A0A1M7DNX0_9ACTN|nr:YafY family protein [Actinacidiphila paucisporea]SHL81165.1 Predicted DNA-binding transcriptional regulator YafY, contains an HTH and WYL domains [Actinacidiphila paucisporea]